ncbi:MAG: hypothetical protein UT16_C0024G0009 [Candidatus Azambacteria bacterium GW2011_GWA2_39_10]|uniref:Uncharacterized protein n=1 Tax=Candidatus Azambacteria bacterium GW2011_GWA2_39_10 TaxID=1618611 RepID=A0A0G0PP91_9BACT|nr:MAG: hypothetical protein UT16_C0024G0009 [Candidatus Azambacteria bacterium GW2011_GWA2_39_10]
MAKNRFMREINIPDFDEFLYVRGILPDNPMVPLLKEAWNQGVESACLYFGNQEGTDYGAMDAVKAL